MNHPRTIVIALAVILLAGVSTGAAAAAEPAGRRLVKFDGVVRDVRAVGLTGEHALTFEIFEASSGGAPVWSESHRLFLEDGAYSVLLGSVVPLVLSPRRDYFLVVTPDEREWLSERYDVVVAVPVPAAAADPSAPGPSVYRLGDVSGADPEAGERDRSSVELAGKNKKKRVRQLVSSDGSVVFDPADGRPGPDGTVNVTVDASLPVGSDVATLNTPQTFTSPKVFERETTFDGAVRVLDADLELAPDFGIRKAITNPYANQVSLFHSNGTFPGDCNSDGIDDEDHALGFAFNMTTSGGVIDPDVHYGEISLETTYCDYTSDRDGDGVPGNSIRDYLVEWNMDLGCPLDLDGDGQVSFQENFRPWFVGAYPCSGTQGEAFAWFMSDRETTGFFSRDGRMSVGHDGRPLAPLDVETAGSSLGLLIRGPAGALNGGIFWDGGTVADGIGTDLFPEPEPAGRTQYKLPAWGGGQHSVVSSQQGRDVRLWCGTVSVDPGAASAGDQFVATQANAAVVDASACSASIRNADEFDPGGGWMLEGCRTSAQTGVRCYARCVKPQCSDVSARNVDFCCHTIE